jgi:hypothetical protein
MATERLRITPDYIIAKNSAGVITYSAGTVPDTGTEFPSYLRSTASSDTINVNSGYDIYYNQIAPIPYPVVNNANTFALQTIGGSIFSLNQVPVVTSNTDIFNTTLTEPGTYVIVPTLWFTESGTPQNYKNKPNLGQPLLGQVAYTVSFNGVSSTVLVTKRVFSDGSIGWFGPTNGISEDPDSGVVSGGELTTVSFNYGMTNPDSLSLSDPASYNPTYSTPIFKLTPSSSALAAAGVSSSWARGVVKVLYYSRGYLKLRYTK